MWGTLQGQEKRRGTYTNVSHAWWFSVVFKIMINPIKPHVCWWISLNMTYRSFVIHYRRIKATRRSHTLALLCRIICVYNFRSTTHVKGNTKFRTQLYRPHMNENSSTKVKKLTWKRNGSNHKFHPDTVTSRLLIANYFGQNVPTRLQSIFFK